MMCEICTGITIGPIVDTITLTSTPAGSWAASTLFSWISRELLRNLLLAGDITDSDILMPYAVWNEKELKFTPSSEAAMKQGIGILCDRIILQGDHADAVKNAREHVLEALAQKLVEIGIGNQQDNYEWAKDYFRITAVKTTVQAQENRITALDSLLNAIELEPVYVQREENSPLITLFANVSSEDETNASDQNARIRSSFLVKEASDWALSSNGRNIRTIGQIAHGFDDGEQWAASKYYAVIAADGDNMGRIVSQLDTPEKIQSFNQHFLEYTGKIALTIRKYGGLPLYAGGDDLLAIVPLFGFNPENESIQSTLFSLLKNCSDIFEMSFSSEIGQIKKQNENTAAEKKVPVPSLSFGISVQYYKSPLYEALECARAEENSAKYGGPCKNTMSFNLRTHSGHSHYLRIPLLNSEEGEKVMQAFIQIISDGRSARTLNQDGDFLFGTVYHLEEMVPLLTLAVQEYIAAATDAEKDSAVIKMKRLFNNVFDSTDQRAAAAQVEDAKELLIGNADLWIKETASASEKNLIDGAAAIVRRTTETLRIARFLSEKGAEEI